MDTVLYEVCSVGMYPKFIGRTGALRRLQLSSAVTATGTARVAAGKAAGAEKRIRSESKRTGPQATNQVQHDQPRQRGEAQTEDAC